MTYQSGPSREFSEKPVYSETDLKGFRRSIYVMYHATDKDNVQSILDNGFRPSTSGMLGPGLYLSRDINKTRNYGNVCFKLLVYTGRTKRMDSADTAGSWRGTYDSAYLPPHNYVVSSGREETCVKSVDQVKVLGIAFGYHSGMHGLVRNMEGTDHNLDEEEERILQKMIGDLYQWTTLLYNCGLVFALAIAMVVVVSVSRQIFIDLSAFGFTFKPRTELQTLGSIWAIIEWGIFGVIVAINVCIWGVIIGRDRLDNCGHYLDSS